jgi:hypothetical protein
VRRGAGACDRSDLSQSFRLPFSFPPPGRPSLPLPVSGLFGFYFRSNARCLAAYLPRFPILLPREHLPFARGHRPPLVRDSAAVASEPGPIPTATAWWRSEAKPGSHARDAGAARRASDAAVVTTGLVVPRWKPCRRACRCGGVCAVLVVARVASADRGAAGSRGPDGCGTSDARARPLPKEKSVRRQARNPVGWISLPPAPFAPPSNFFLIGTNKKKVVGAFFR